MTQDVDTSDEHAATEEPQTDADSPVEASADPQEAGGDEISPQAIVEALLFASDAALNPSRMAQIVGIGTARDVKGHIDALNERYEADGLSFRIRAISGGFQMFTLPAFDPWIQKLHKAKSETRLSQAALETLAIVAYRQPIIRADIEAVRGVAVGDVLIRLRDMKLVKIVGRAEEVGRPLLYGTTNRFLEVFGLHSLKDLPKLDEEDGGGVPKLKLAEPDTEESQPADPAPTDDGSA